MKNFVHCMIPKKKRGIIFFLGFLLQLKAMDSPHFQNSSPDKPQAVVFQKKIKVWDNEDLVTQGKESSRYIPKSMIITPDQRGVLYTKPGEVYFVSKETMVPSEPHLMCRHSDNQYHPLIAAAMKTPNVLVLISVLNRAKQAPECMISNHRIKKSTNISHNIFASNQFKYLHLNSNVKSIGASTDWDESNVQAIGLNSANGEYLAIAFKNFVQLVDLVTETCYRSIFPQTTSPHTSFVVDVSVPVSNFLQQKERHVAAADRDGRIDCKRLTSDDVFMNVKNAQTGDRIENVHLMPGIKEVWYVTENGQVNTIDFRTFLEHYDNAIQRRMVSYHEGSKASVDQGLEQTTIHWVNNPQASDTVRLQINVYRESSNGRESFVIELPDTFSKIYNCIGAQGQITSAHVCVSSAAVRGNVVAAFLTNGEIAFWKLPEKHQAPLEDTVKGYNAAEILNRGRSHSSPVAPDELIKKQGNISSDETRRSGKKTASPKMAFFKSKESIKPEKGDKGNGVSIESPRKKSETPFKRKSPASSPAEMRNIIEDVVLPQESKLENARNEDIYNDFIRVQAFDHRKEAD